jgi:hypothetical protein
MAASRRGGGSIYRSAVSGFDCTIIKLKWIHIFKKFLLKTPDISSVCFSRVASDKCSIGVSGIDKCGKRALSNKIPHYQIQDDRKFTQPIIKYLLMVAIEYNWIGLINTEYRCDYTRAYAGHVML